MTFISLIFYAIPKIWLINITSSVIFDVPACPLCIMWRVSTQAIMEQAELKFLKPSIELVTRLMCLWSCSIMLFRYLTVRCSTLQGKLPQYCSSIIATSVAACLSVVITLGIELWGEERALFKNFLADFLSRFIDNQKSIVLPEESTSHKDTYIYHGFSNKFHLDAMNHC